MTREHTYSVTLRHPDESIHKMRMQDYEEISVRAPTAMDALARAPEAVVISMRDRGIITEAKDWAVKSWRLL